MRCVKTLYSMNKCSVFSFSRRSSVNFSNQLKHYLRTVVVVVLVCFISAKIQRMKNAVPKNDKKKRKQLTEEIAKLEADLNQKHEEEFRQLKSTTDTKVNACSHSFFA